jgi:hypothetical protein
LYQTISAIIVALLVMAVGGSVAIADHTPNHSAAQRTAERETSEAFATNARGGQRLEMGRITLQQACENPTYARVSGNCGAVTASPTAATSEATAPPKATATTTAKAAAAQYGVSKLPATGGVALLALLTGVMLVIGGVMAKRVF